MEKEQLNIIEKKYESKILKRVIPVLFYDTYASINNCQQHTYEHLDSIFKNTLEDAQNKIYYFYSKKYPETLKQLERYGFKVGDIEKIMPKPSNAADLLKHYKLNFVGIPSKDECVEGLLILYFDVSWDGASALPVIIKENKVIKVGNIEF